MVKQAIKKKTFAKPSLSELRALGGFKEREGTPVKDTNAEKKLEFITMPEAFVEATKLPGIPMGYVTLCEGWSNTGKSTIKNCLIASCQQRGILPVIFETENNFDWQYARDCGMEFEDIIGDVIDPNTGEVIPNQVIDHDGFYFFYNNTILAEHCGKNDYATGKETKTCRKQAVIEDIAYKINDLLDKQDRGDLPYSMCFIWDSIGSIGSFKSYTSKSGNNMFDAGAISQAFNNIINNRIPSSRSVASDYTNTFFGVNKIWNDSMNSMGGVPSIELKGGKTFFYAARLILHLGGIAKSSVKALKATAKGLTYQYGIVTKIKTQKNQLPSPFNVNYESSLCCVGNGLLSEDKLDEYKKNEMKQILDKLLSTSTNPTDVSIEEEDINFVEEETSEE